MCLSVLVSGRGGGGGGGANHDRKKIFVLIMYACLTASFLYASRLQLKILTGCHQRMHSEFCFQHVTLPLPTGSCVNHETVKTSR